MSKNERIAPASNPVVVPVPVEWLRGCLTTPDCARPTCATVRYALEDECSEDLAKEILHVEHHFDWLRTEVVRILREAGIPVDWPLDAHGSRFEVRYRFGESDKLYTRLTLSCRQEDHPENCVDDLWVELESSVVLELPMDSAYTILAALTDGAALGFSSDNAVGALAEMRRARGRTDWEFVQGLLADGPDDPLVRSRNEKEEGSA
jgi:hypothetical protein